MPNLFEDEFTGRLDLSSEETAIRGDPLLSDLSIEPFARDHLDAVVALTAA